MADARAGGPAIAPGRIDVAIVGAGIAGLAAAAELARVGRRVVLLEKSRGVGGRMATRRLGGGTCDHGAQFFTVRGAEFGGIVAAAEAAGAVTTWCEGFGRSGSIGGQVAAAADGHQRWRGRRGMTDLPKLLASGLPADRCEIRTGVRASSIGAAEGRVRIAVEDAAASASPEVLEAAAAIVTSPVPQSLDLFAAGGLLGAEGGVAADVRRRLESVDYDPCFALMVVLDRPSLVPPPGAIQCESGPVSWIADNMQKGISAVPTLTVHASGDFSRRHFDDPPDDVAARLVELVGPWIDGDPATAIVERSLHRWKFALPTTILQAPLVAALESPPIVCCGDAFGGPRVEGAAASGLAAGRWVERRLATGDG
jgi:predicted NAD/FAD-dependent oxidoreductase